VTAYLLQGYPLQAAFEQSGDLLQSRYRDWYRNLAQLPFWEENIDRQVQLYLSGIQNVALANLNWRFVSLRFLYLLQLFPNHMMGFHILVSGQIDTGMAKMTK
jgi:hypothetical protein